MFIKQLSVFVENKFGRLESILEALSSKNIDISALSIADTTDFGILRLIVNDPETALEALKENGVVVKITDVLAVAMDDKPGGLLKVLRLFTENEITIEYMYAFVSQKQGRAMTVIKTDDMKKTDEILIKNGMTST